MTGRELLEALMMMDPADLELEVVARGTGTDGYGNTCSVYETDVSLLVEHVTRRDIPLLGTGKSRNDVFRVLTLG